MGYARVSTDEQNLDFQRDALEDAKCERVFTDTASGAKEDRPQLAECLRYLRSGDTLVVWKLDRLSRSTQHLLRLADELRDRGIELRIITLGVDTATPVGRMFYTVLGAIGEFERELIRERTHAGLAAARARGRVGGRKPKLSARQAGLAREMYAEKGGDGKRLHTVAAIARELKVARTTVYSYLGDTDARAA